MADEILTAQTEWPTDAVLRLNQEVWRSSALRAKLEQAEQTIERLNTNEREFLVELAAIDVALARQSAPDQPTRRQTIEWLTQERDHLAAENAKLREACRAGGRGALTPGPGPRGGPLMADHLIIKDVGQIEKIGPDSWRVTVLARHMCGLQGYNPLLGDTCPACEQSRQLWDRRLELREEPR